MYTKGAILSSLRDHQPDSGNFLFRKFRNNWFQDGYSNPLKVPVRKLSGKGYRAVNTDLLRGAFCGYWFYTVSQLWPGDDVDAYRVSGCLRFGFDSPVLMDGTFAWWVWRHGRPVRTIHYCLTGDYRNGKDSVRNVTGKICRKEGIVGRITPCS